MDILTIFSAFVKSYTGIILSDYRLYGFQPEYKPMNSTKEGLHGATLRYSYILANFLCGASKSIKRTKRYI